MEPFSSATSIRDDVLAGRTSVQSVVEATLARIDALDGDVAAFLDVHHDAARARAVELDRRVKEGSAAGRLFGVPVAVKDNICVQGHPTTCGSRILERFRPPYDAHVVERLKAEGAVVIGKTNLDEFGMGSSTENSAFRPTRNPHDLARVPGGSSGGSAAAVAAGMVPIALGSDTGGSVRQPASLCGVVGFKPTYGHVSRYGLVAFASSLDQVGILGGSVRDVAETLTAIATPDARDSTCLDHEPGDYSATLSRDLEGVRFGVHPDLLEKIGDGEVRSLLDRAVSNLREAGARIVRLDDLDLLTRHAISTYYLVATSEASSNLARFDGMRYGSREAAEGLVESYARTRGAGFGDEVKRRILLGTFALSAGYRDAYYQRALKARRLLRRAFDAAFDRVDMILGGTSPIPAFPLGENVGDPLTMYRADVLTVPASLAGLPAVSVPCGTTPAALPVGLQFIGRALDDAAVLSRAFAFEQRFGGRPKPAALAGVAP